MKFCTLSLLFFVTFSTFVGAQTLYTPGGTVASSATANVGIGTSSPLFTLSTANGGTIATTVLRLQNSYLDYNGYYGVQLAGIDNGVNGHDLKVQGRTGATSLFADLVTFKNNGNVGIGTTNPLFPLSTANGGTIAATVLRLQNTYLDTNGYYGIQLAGIDNGVNGHDLKVQGRTGATSPFADLVTFKNNGNVGIGTANPGSSLQVQSTGPDSQIYVSSVSPRIALGDNPVYSSRTQAARLVMATVAGHYAGPLVPGDTWLFTEGINGGGAGKLYLGANSLLTMAFDLAGNVGIGTANPGANKLAVNGTIRAKEVIVDTGWSDYVFASDYTLAPLSEVEAHIKAHHTLPGVPSEAQVAKHGISVGEMQAKLLAKVEELTLYVIDLKKENAALKAAFAEIKSSQLSK